MRIAFLFTCYNRIEKTRKCIESVQSAIKYVDSKIKSEAFIEDYWYITDAGSSDGTVDMIRSQIDTSRLHIRVENSDTYYSQGMRKAMEMLKSDLNGAKEDSSDEDKLQQADKIDYVFIINDDVVFYEDFLYRLLEQTKDSKEAAERQEKKETSSMNAVIVGATDNGIKQTYGGVRYKRPVEKSILPRSIHYDMVKIDDINRECDTFNANCVMVPGDVFSDNEVIDEHFAHGLGDFDYGFSLKINGNRIYSSDFYVGSCDNNTKAGTWMDTSLSRVERIKKLNSVKGAPTKQWFYYLNKNFGLLTAFVHSVSPYFRIIMKK